MHEVSWTRRLAIPAGVLVLAAAVMAVLFPEPRTVRNIAEAFFLGLTAPFSTHWLLASFTGPLRHALLVLLFVVLPVFLFPVYTLRPRKSTAILTGIGIGLWIFSSLLTLTLWYVVD